MSFRLRLENCRLVVHIAEPPIAKALLNSVVSMSPIQTCSAPQSA